MALAIVDKIPRMEVMGLQFGDAAKGLIVAGAGDALGLLVTRFVPGALPPVAVKLGIAAAIQWKPVKDLIGKDAAMVGSLFLVADAIRSLYDIRGKTTTTLAGFIGSVIPAGTPAMAAKMGARMGATQRDYYAQAEGRAA